MKVQIKIFGFQLQLIHTNMKHEHHPFENQIFHEFRVNERAVKKAIKLLKEKGYKIYKEEKEH